MKRMHGKVRAQVRKASSEILPVSSPWLNTREAARYTRRSAAYLSNLAVTGKGPRYSQETPGGRRLYRRDWLDTWLESFSRTSTTEAPEGTAAPTATP